MILAGVAALWVLLEAIFVGPERAGISLPDPGTEAALYRAELLVPPEWLSAALSRLPRLDPWIYALVLLVVLPVLLTLCIDWAAGRRRNTHRAPLDDIPRLDRRSLRSRGGRHRP
ncbi:hypothetical protein [Paracoccus sp. SJTW-4]|uniref:hypothetical protein n=1 Tax=Paracoccus sp. SJTW-4 TaxID=3078428 RepID=UPI0039EA640D